MDRRRSTIKADSDSQRRPSTVAGSDFQAIDFTNLAPLGLVVKAAPPPTSEGEAQDQEGEAKPQQQDALTSAVAGRRASTAGSGGGAWGRRPSTVTEAGRRNSSLVPAGGFATVMPRPDWNPSPVLVAAPLIRRVSTAGSGTGRRGSRKGSLDDRRLSADYNLEGNGTSRGWRRH